MAQTTQTDPRQTARSAGRRALRSRLANLDGVLGPRDLERMMWDAICETGNRSGGDPEEQAELTARLALEAGRALDAIRRDRGTLPLRRSDVERIAVAIRDGSDDLTGADGEPIRGVEAVRREYRREHGLALLDPEAGAADHIHAAEQAALRKVRSMNLPTCDCGRPERPGVQRWDHSAPHTCADPAPDWLRGVAKSHRAGERALLLSAILPDVTSAEWSRAERCAPGVFRDRIADTRESLLTRSPDRSAERIAILAGDLLDAEPDDRDLVAALLRFIGPAPDKSAGALPRPDTCRCRTCRDRREAAQSVRTRKRLAPIHRTPATAAPTIKRERIAIAKLDPDAKRRRREDRERARLRREWADKNADRLRREARRRKREREAAETRERIAREDRDRKRAERMRRKARRPRRRPAQVRQNRRAVRRTRTRLYLIATRRRSGRIGSAGAPSGKGAPMPRASR